MSLIDINNLHFSYKAGKIKIPIFSNFNLRIEKGDFVAIRGPSGSGKSTLLYLLAGLLKFKKGSIHLDGRDISKLSDLDLSILRNKEIGFIFQQFHLLTKTSVLENILLPTLYPIEIRKKEKGLAKKANDIAKNLGIEDRLNHTPNQLSGGQQQRVAIARALINDANIILADEPTGNLDSKSTGQIISVLKKLHANGKTIILITHEDEVANSASKIYHLKDGQIQEDLQDTTHPASNFNSIKLNRKKILSTALTKYFKIFPLVISNAFKHKARSILTMLGITVGVAAVCSMITLGNFTKEKILDSYTELGVNTIVFRGHPNWQLKATDQFPAKYKFFDWENELVPLKKILPDIKLISPSLSNWNTSVTFAGKSIEEGPKLTGISEDGLSIINRNLIAGRGITQYHIERKHSVCVIGYDIGKRLFPNLSPIDQIIHISQESSTFACKIIGILENKTSNKEWSKPNLQIFIPFTVFQAISEHWWSSQIKQVTILLRKGANVEKVGQALRAFFEKKYGKSGRFRVDSDSILLAQMEKFLTLFSILLVGIAVVSLGVGGMGITNMMLVSVSERLKEIGIRKSVGATNSSIRYQFLFESIVLCLLAGIFGIITGVVAYQGAIYGASRLIAKLQFEWIVDPLAIILSLVSILTVGVISGLAPAIKAEKLQVIDALRSE